MHPQPIVGLGNPAIFVQGSTQNYKEYTSLETLAKDFATTTTVYKKQKLFGNRKTNHKLLQ